MSTTSLFVEILAIGAIADIWLCLIFLAIVSPSVSSISGIVQSSDGFSLLLAVPFLAVTYVLGWTVNFLADTLFRRLYQRKTRDKMINEANLKDKDYVDIRSYFSQKASEKLIRDWEYTRHAIRMARSSTLNFIVMTGALLLHLNVHRQGIMVATALSIAIAAVAFWQARTLSRANYRRLMADYKMLKEEDAQRDKNEATTAERVHN